MYQEIPVCTLEKPAFRPLDISPVMHQGREYLMVRDPMGVIEGAALLALDPLLLVFIQMADGNTTVGEMAQRATMMTGQIIPAGMFEGMVKQLDEALLLQSERFRDALVKRFEKWQQSPTRTSRIFANNGAGSDRLQMLKEIGDEFRRHEMSSYSPPAQLDLPRAGVQAILAPHIDYQRGGEAYAWAYKALKDNGTAPRIVIVLGTSHRPSLSRFIATRKDYETPFGTIPTNREVLAELEALHSYPLFEDEFLHADEHTVELQAVYLKKIFQDREFTIVPILVSSFDDLLVGETSPSQDPEIASFVAALRTLLDKHGDDIALVGGVDFSHCGPEFGDEQLNEPEVLKAVEAGDRASLAAVEAINPEAYFNSYREGLNATKVCSIGTVYAVLAAMKDRGPGKLLSYQQSNSNDKSCLVTFASAAFLKKGAELKPASRIILLS